MYAYSGHPLYKGRTRSRNCSTEECVHVHGLSYLPTILHAAWDKERWLALRQIGDPLADSALEAGLGYHKGADPLAALLAVSRSATSDKNPATEGVDGKNSTTCTCNPDASVQFECKCSSNNSSVSGSSCSRDAPLPYSLPALTRASRALLDDLHRVPDWVDFAAIARAQRWYLRHLPLASLGVLHVGLIGGFSAPMIHPTLRATGYLTSAAAPQNTRRRVFETMRFVADLLGDCKQPEGNSCRGGDRGDSSSSGGSCKEGSCRGNKNGNRGAVASVSNDGAECLKPGGRGWAACIKVRLVHAAVRYRLLTRPLHSPGRSKEGSKSNKSDSVSKCDRSTPQGVKAPVEGGIWTPEDVAARGLPVCLSDVVATQLAFGGCTLLGMANAGVKFTRDEANDYLHMWRWVGHLLGIPEEHNACAPPVNARATTATATAAAARQNATPFSSGDAGLHESSTKQVQVVDDDGSDDKGGDKNDDEDETYPLDVFSGATAALETVVHYAFEPNDYSRQFAASVLGALGADGPLKAPLAHHHAWAHVMLGRPLADALALPRPPTNYWGWSLPKYLIPCLAYFFRFLAWLASPPKWSREPPEPCNIAKPTQSTTATAGVVATVAAAVAASAAVFVVPSRHNANVSWTTCGAAAATAAASSVAVVHVYGWVQKCWTKGWERLAQRIENRHHRILNAVMKSVLRSSKPGLSARGSCTAFDAPLSDTLCPAL